MRFSLLVLSAIIGFRLLIPDVYAELEPAKLLLTWRATNFYPANFRGKAEATPGSSVSVSLEIIQSNKFTDLARADFSWFLDEKPLVGGIGLKEVVFVVKNAAGRDHFVRVVVQKEEVVYEDVVRIPISKPQVVVQTPHPEGIVEAESEAILQAVPFFFNVSSFEGLAFSWKVNEIALEEGSSRLAISLGTPTSVSERTIYVTSFVQNQARPREFARERVRLKVF